jgi:hypothetical protein
MYKLWVKERACRSTAAYKIVFYSIIWWKWNNNTYNHEISYFDYCTICTAFDHIFTSSMCLECCWKLVGQVNILLVREFSKFCISNLFNEICCFIASKSTDKISFTNKWTEGLNALYTYDTYWYHSEINHYYTFSCVFPRRAVRLR